MSKNEKPEIKSWGEGQLKEKQTKVNKKRRNDNKLPEEKRGPEPEDISKTFPNFSVLTEEERLAFFQALTTARKNAENKGVPTRKCFGTVHDEYLKYFEQSDQGEEDKQEENRSIRSNFTLRDNGTNRCTNQSETQVEAENPKEEKLSTPGPFSLDDTQNPPRSSITATLETNIWEQYESLIQTEANKVVDLFIKKKKIKEEKAESLQYEKKIFENTGSGNKNWIALRFSKELDTPRFDALNPEEKEVFFKILQEAYDNVLQQNPNEDFQILPLDAILRRYQGCDEMAAVFASIKESRRTKEPKREIKVSVTVSAKGNEGLVQQTNASRLEKPKKNKLENQNPVEIEDCCQSQEVVQKAEKVTLEPSFADSRTPESEIVAYEPSKESLKPTKTSSKKKQTKSCRNETANNEKNKLKKKGKEKKSECREHAQEVTDVSPVPSAEKESIPERRSDVQVFQKNSGEMEEVDCMSVLSVSEKSFEDNPLSQSSSHSEKTKEDHKETEPEEKRSETSVTVTQQEPEKTDKEPETATPTKPEDNKLEKKVSFDNNNPEKGSSEPVKENANENAKNESEVEQVSMGKEDQKEKSSSEDPLEAKTKDISWNRVMLVNGDVVEKLKRLIYYLEAKAIKDSHLEKEYLRLLVDYADYLSKVLESLILKKEKQQNQQKNAHEVPEFRHHHDDSQKETEPEPKSVEPEFPSTSSTKPESQKKHLTFAVMEETIKDPDRDLDLNLPVLSDSESLGSEGETRFKYRRDGRDRILPTKIRMLQDVLRQRAEFVEGNFDDFKVIQLPEEKFVPEDKPPTVKLLAEDETKGQMNKKKKLFEFMSKIFTCGRRPKTSTEDGVLENLRGEAFRVEMTKSKKDPASAVLNQATLEVLKAVERKKIIDKYFMKS